MAGEGMSPTMQKLSSVLPRLGSAWHMAVPPTPVHQETGDTSLPGKSSIPPLILGAHTCTASQEARLGAQHLKLASYWGKDLVPGS